MHGNDDMRFSPAFLVEKWGLENGYEKKNSIKKMKMNNDGQQKVKNGSRKYKGQSGRISKDGSTGYFDVDARGRMYCV